METNIVSSTWERSVAAHGETELDQRPDKVYLTADPSIARVYAAVWKNPLTNAQGGGAVYEVDVTDGSLEVDPDMASYNCWQADSAVIERVHEASVPHDQEMIEKRLAPIRAEQAQRDQEKALREIVGMLKRNGID
ncbi:hypothetical protein B1A87_007740 [Arthrobacter sp. KBS0703]|uniref:hypothetical protein n=1 Tax=Arthrobacter sp. KBS0703 TaxID=1955698 RepID=UPI0011169B5E|nr:hypothetical protein [Arthrobacter sp. KBS0703]TSE15805.1 hypothetical protein B1A87_007740 [Arthrobacter sp. KBS0703]